MKKRLVVVLALVLVFTSVFFAGCGNKAPEETPAGDISSIKLNVGTGGTTGTYYGFCNVISTVLKEKTGAQLTIQSSGASKANILGIADGDVDMAIVQNDVMDYGYKGTDLFAEEGAADQFATVAALYAEVCQVVATKDIASIEDLKGKRVSVGDAGSGVEFNARQILEAYDITFEDISVNNLGFGDSSDALKDGKIDAFFCTAGAPTTAIVELATTNDINLLAIDDAHAAKLAEAYPFYTTYPIPGGSYKGVDEDVQTVAIKATLIASPKLSEDVVYNLTKAIFDNKEEIASAHAKGEELSLEYAVSGISVPFHPGAEKYFKEVGALK